MAKLDRGNKRICQNCSAPFYDLRRDPIVCPKCDAVFDLEAVLKSRRPRGQTADAANSAKSKAKKETPAPAEEPADEKVEVEVEVEVEAEAEAEVDPDAPDADAPAAEEDTPADDGDDDTVLEDASDLGDDDGDVAGVVDETKKEEET